MALQSSLNTSEQYRCTYNTVSTTTSAFTVPKFSSPLHAFRLTMRLLCWPRMRNLLLFIKKNGDLEPYYKRDIHDQPIICSQRVDDDILCKNWNLIINFCLIRIRLCSFKNDYSRPSKVEHNPFQGAVRLSICSTFELNGISRTMLCNAALMVRLSNFYSSFKQNFSRIFSEFQVVRESNRSTFEGPLYIQKTSANRVLLDR
jgi:hypothetical protein